MKVTNKILGITFGVLVITIFCLFLSFKLYIKNNMMITAKAVEYSNAESTTYTYTNFSKIDLTNINDAQIAYDQSFFVCITKPEEVPLEISKDGSTLKFTAESQYSDQIAVEITLPKLEYLSSNGITNIEISGFAQQEANMRFSNKTDLSASNCQFENLGINSSGMIDLDFGKSDVKRADLQCEGFGDIILNMSNGEISGMLSGAVDISLIGNAGYSRLKRDGLCRIKTR